MRISIAGGIIGAMEYWDRKLHFLNRIMEIRFSKEAHAPLTDMLGRAESQFDVSQRARLLYELLHKFPSGGSMRSKDEFGNAQRISLSEAVGSLADKTRDLPATALFFLSVRFPRSKAIRSIHFDDVTVPGPWEPSVDCSFDVANPTITKSVRRDDLESCHTLRLGLRFGIKPISIALAVASIAWGLAYLNDYPPPQRFISAESRQEFMESYSACNSLEALALSGHLHQDGNSRHHLLELPLEAIGISAERALCAEKLFQMRHGSP